MNLEYLVEKLQATRRELYELAAELADEKSERRIYQLLALAGWLVAVRGWL